MLSILIVNWNTRDLLVSCLKSIYLHPPSGAFEVIVVDNASSDGSAEAVELTFPNVVLVKSQQNLGYAAGNNLAFERSTGEWILTLNADTEVYDSSLDVGIERISLNPDTGALGAMQIGDRKSVV